MKSSLSCRITVLLVLALAASLPGRAQETYQYVQRDSCALYLDIWRPAAGAVTSLDGVRKPAILFVFRSAALKILNVQSYTEAAQDCRSEFLACPGPAGAAEFILQAPHAGNGRDPLKELRNETGKAMSAYYLGDLLLVLALRFGLKVKPAWLFGVLGLLASPLLQKKLMDRNYRKRIRS